MKRGHAAKAPVDCTVHIVCTWHAHIQYLGEWLRMELRSDDSLSFAERLRTTF